MLKRNLENSEGEGERKKRYDGGSRSVSTGEAVPIGRATIMQIRGQYLIQDNHDDYTSQSAFSRGRGNVMCARTYTQAHATPSPIMIAPLPFFSPIFLSTLSRLRSALDRPQAGSRGKNASLLIIQYARDAPGKRERERERRIYLPTRRLESISLKKKKKNPLSFSSPLLSSLLFLPRNEKSFEEERTFIVDRVYSNFSPPP